MEITFNPRWHIREGRAPLLGLRKVPHKLLLPNWLTSYP
jgi:hypothetical protein